MGEEDDYEQPTSGGGGMVEHIQKYKSYIQGLKQGHSSGISAAFGRAAELLPPDVLEVVPPKITGALTVGRELDEPVFADGYDRAALRSAVEDLIAGCADQLADFIGVSVMTAEGESEVVNCFVEDGQRKFMLANLDVIDEAEFTRSRRDTDGDPEYGEQSDDSDQSDDGEQRDDARSDDRHGDGKQSDDGDQSDDGAHLDDGEQGEQGELQSETGFDRGDDVSGTRDACAPWGEERPFDLVVHAPAGNVLWGIHYDGLEIEQIVMSDGTQIRRAEGRHEYVMVQRANDRLHPRIYILSGLMVDPLTGNVYAEANQGGYTAAFLNNGWQIHQYRSRDSTDSFFVKEPDRPGRSGAFFEVVNLALDAESGEVSYDTIDSAATVTLKSRRLSFG
ncbi:MAG: hypothetical protein U0103_13560 [Candidatus Obscuribacterales bacterium]